MSFFHSEVNTYVQLGEDLNQANTLQRSDKDIHFIFSKNIKDSSLISTSFITSPDSPKIPSSTIRIAFID